MAYPYNIQHLQTTILTLKMNLKPYITCNFPVVPLDKRKVASEISGCGSQFFNSNKLFQMRVDQCSYAEWQVYMYMYLSLYLCHKVTVRVTIFCITHTNISEDSIKLKYTALKKSPLMHKTLNLEGQENNKINLNIGKIQF